MKIAKSHFLLKLEPEKEKKLNRTENRDHLPVCPGGQLLALEMVAQGDGTRLDERVIVLGRLHALAEV